MKFTAAALGLQVVRRTGRVRDRGRPDRRRRPQWLRQVEPARGAALGDGRKLVQEHARVRHGRRHLLRHGAPAPPATSPRSRSRSTMPTARRRPRFNDADDLRGVAPHRARGRARPTASTARRRAPATCSCCSPMPRPAPARRPWSRQGQIGELIKAKPQARRRILEEAAGISGLHTRRHEAELRLKAAEAQPRRGWTTSSASSRPSSTASSGRRARPSRYRELSADIRKAEAMLLHAALGRGFGHRRARAGRLEAWSCSWPNRPRACRGRAAMHEAAETALPPLRENAAVAAAALRRLERRAAALEREEQEAERAARSSTRRLAEAAGDATRAGELSSRRGRRASTGSTAKPAARPRHAGERRAAAPPPPNARRRGRRAGRRRGRRHDAAAAGLAAHRAGKEALTRRNQELADRIRRLADRARRHRRPPRGAAPPRGHGRRRASSLPRPRQRAAAQRPSG